METITKTESRTDALRRLLVVAKESGVRLLRDSHGEMWATSVSDPGWLHKLEPGSCSCRGFSQAGRCRHQAALLAHLGWLDDPEPDPAPMGCPVCQDTGEMVVRHSRWIGGGRLGFRDVWTTLTTCHECGEVVAA
jgi:hypothetical protein